MRTSLRLFVGLAVVGAQIAAVATGCGGSDSNNNNPTTTPDSSSSTPDTGTTGTDGSSGNDSASSGDTATDTTVAPTITIVANDLNVYLGQIAQLDASGTTVSPTGQPTYAWTVTSAPPGSAIATISIFNAGSAQPSFTPDVVGDYVLNLKVSAGGVTQEKTVTVKAFQAQAFYMYSEGDGGKSDRIGVRAKAPYRDAGATELSCHAWDGGATSLFSLFSAEFGGDIWEGPPGSPSKIVYGTIQHETDAATTSAVYVVSSDQTCATPPTKLSSPFLYSNEFPVHPKFSPDGQRIAYVSGRATQAHIVTIGSDGQNEHVVGALMARPDGGQLPDAAAPFLSGSLFSPRWLDNTTIGWLQLTTGGKWQIVTSTDTNGSSGALYMSCSALDANSPELPKEFAFTKDGSVLVSQRVKFNDAGKLGPRDLLLYKPNAATKQCELVRNLTQLFSDGGAQFSTVDDFSLSPDGTQVAYLAFDYTADAGPNLAARSVWTVSVDGLTPPAVLPGAPKAGAFVQLGPRFIGGGSSLIWAQDERSVDAGDGGAFQATLVASSVGGGDFRVVDVTRGPNRTVHSIGNGYACSIATAGGSGVAAFGAGAAFVSLLIRRRKRNK